MGSERCKGIGVKLVTAVSTSSAEICFDIPEWLLIDVLIRLPVKQVFRFKLVCKQWLSVISDHYFISMYVSRASMSPQFQTWTFISTRVANNRLSYKYELLEDVYSQDLKFPCRYVLPCPFSGQPDWELYKVVGVSNGLVLYAPPRGKGHLLNYYICNPITRQYVPLPPHACRFWFFERGFVTNVENGILTSYRVVRVEQLLYEFQEHGVEVFVSEIGEWKNYTICFDRVIDITLPDNMPTALNGILHWITREHGIVAYDPYHKPDCMRFIELPGDTHSYNANSDKHTHGLECDVYQGHLRCFELSYSFARSSGFSIFVWILNDYNTEDWCLQHKIHVADVLYDGNYSRPISFHPFDSEIFYLVSERHTSIFVSFNIKTQKLEVLPDQTNVRHPYGWSYAIPFVIPRWPAYITPLSSGVSKD